MKTDSVTTTMSSTADVRLCRPKLFFPDMRVREGERKPRKAEIRISVNEAEVMLFPLEEGNHFWLTDPIVVRAGEALKITSSEPDVRAEV